MSKRITTYKCMYCDKRFNRSDLVNHVGEDHEDMIPEDFTPLRLVFNYVNKKPLSYHGKCTECGGATPWDENKGRYDRQCGKKACHDRYVKKFENNMVNKRGVKRITSTEEGQKKMLANRKISGTYTFQDGGKKTYTGSYELKALEFMDKVMNLKSADIMAPGPTLEYQFEGKTHMYITDFYYQPYNLVIEVKDGGSNPNKRSMPEYRAKQIEKEKFIIKNTNYNYLRLTDNNLSQLLSIFCTLKMQLVENSGERVVKVNESVTLEAMNALLSGKVPGLKDSDAYIVNYIQHSSFNPGWEQSYGVTNSIKLDRIFGKDINGNLGQVNPDTISNVKIYKLPITIGEVSKIISPYIGKEIDNKFIYEALIGKKLYTYDQIACDNLPCVKSLTEDCSDIYSEFTNYLLYGQSKVQLEQSLYNIESELSQIKEEIYG